MKSLVTGGSGFIGQHLIRLLKRPVIVGRNQKQLQQLFKTEETYQWDQSTPLGANVFDNVDTVFHLAGESVFKGRWNTAKKERIMRSRVDGTRRIIESMAQLTQPPKTLICASAIGYYGDRGDTLLTESSPPGNDFLAEVSVAWENEASKAEKLGIRVVQIRIGVVLGKDGGALPQMLRPFRLGVGGRIGAGNQYMSWIHIDDLVGIMLFSAENQSVIGPVNAVAPEPVTNKEFTATLAKKLFRPAFFHVPGCVLKITLGEFADVLLTSQRVVPEKAGKAGYTFTYPRLSDALQDLI